MLWRLMRKLARLYSLAAIALLLVMIAGDYINPHLRSEEEAVRAMFLPWGVLAGLVLSWLSMNLGALVTLMAAGGFFLLASGQNGAPMASPWPLFVAGPAFLFLLASALRSISRKK